MEIARIEVGRTTGHCIRRERIPAGIVGASVRVAFADPVWDNLIKTVVFRGEETRIAEFDGTVAVIPHEVVASEGVTIFFGIYGYDPETDLQLPLIEVRLGSTEAATNVNADPGADPALPIWAQLQQDVEKLKQNSGGNVELDATLTEEGKAADAKAVGDAIAEIGSLEQTNVGVKGWTSGRIESGNHVANSYMAYSEIMPNKRQTIYFDDTKYKLLYIYYDENSNKVGYKGWLTSSPVGIAVDDPYIRLQINALGSTKFTEDILNDLPNQITWPEYKYPISETVANLEKANFARYVDGANGDDNNPGTAEAPFATIQAGVNSGAKTLYIAPGDYAESVTIQGRDELTILPTAYPEDYDIASPDTPMIHITGGEDKTIGRAMLAENCGKVNITGVWGDNTKNSVFGFFNVKSLTMTGCWGSDSGNAENTFNLVNTNAAFYRCKAWNSARDGFGCTKHGDVRLYDCVAHDCADDGVSHHNSCTGIVSGGEFYNNGKGGVASPTYGSYVDVTGVYSHDNAYGLYTTNESTRRESVGRVNDNVFLNNTTADMLIGSNCRITGWQNIYQTKTGSGVYTENIDNPESSGNADGKAIIDVTELPTENIREDVFYRLLTGSFVYNQFINNTWICHTVDGLPEVGEPVTLDRTSVTSYYNTQDGNAYGYINDMLSTMAGVPVGWYPLDVLAGAFGIKYSGIITNILDDPRDASYRLLLEYTRYSYKAGWTNDKKIGMSGTGNGAEVFNHPSNKAYGHVSHAEGRGTVAGVEGVESYGAHAEGDNTTASGSGSHAEGDYTKALGHASHAEGAETTASGDWSHAEGYNTTASGDKSHAEGYNTTASGDWSHAEGYNTTASGFGQHVQGYFNIEDANNKYLHIVGNGGVNNRSNAHTLDWDGNAWFAGSVEGTALILKAPGGKRFKITVDDSGNLSATATTE